MLATGIADNELQLCEFRDTKLNGFSDNIFLPIREVQNGVKS